MEKVLIPSTTLLGKYLKPLLSMTESNKSNVVFQKEIPHKNHMTSFHYLHTPTLTRKYIARNFGFLLWDLRVNSFGNPAVLLQQWMHGIFCERLHPINILRCVNGRDGQHPTAVTWGVGLICTHMVSYALRTNPSKSKYSNILGFKVTASCSLISNNNNNNQAYGAVSLNRIYHLLKSDSLTRSVFPTHAAIHTFRAVQSLYLCFASLQNKQVFWGSGQFSSIYRGLRGQFFSWPFPLHRKHTLSAEMGKTN